MLFEGKKILITGGTGSLGTAITRRLLKYDVDTIRIFSRNEQKQIQMESEISDGRLRFFLGDVRDPHRLEMALEDVDIVYHAAALKHVPKIEYNPFEAIKTNVMGSQNVIDACIKNNVERAICVGTDKAVSPLNTYGATKLLMEKLFVTANNFLNKEKYSTRFTALRYGNVLGSSGSVVPKITEQIKNHKTITITDPQMTRFSITMNEALDFILNATEISRGSEIFIPKLQAYSIIDLVDVLEEIFGESKHEIIGIRPGEKLHETLINREEIRYSWEFNNMYMITNPLYPLFNDNEINSSYSGIQKIENLTEYSSDTVVKISKTALKNSIKSLNL